MSKLLSPEFLAHLAQPVTSIATCWLIVRLDGVQFAFTTLDADIDMPIGTPIIGGLTYKSTWGFSRTAITYTSDGQVDNLEALGYFSEPGDNSGITEQDLNNGRFNFASVYLFAVNWQDLTMGVCRLRRGWLGECTFSPNGAYQAELRGLTQALVQEFGNFFSPLCRADLGDAQCKVPIVPAPWQPNTYYAAGQYVGPLAISSQAQSLWTFLCTTAGRSGAVEPDWNYGGATPDGAAVWQTQSPFRQIGTVIAQNAPAWQPDADYLAGAYVGPLAVTSVAQGCTVWVCTTPGTSGAVEPAWSYVAGVTIADGSCVWELLPPGPIAQNQFSCKGLAYPGNELGNTAIIQFEQNITANTAIEISDGINTYAYSIGWDVTLGAFYYALTGAIAANNMGLDMTFVTNVGGFPNIYLTNHSGQQGWITKTGDAALGIVISNFTQNYLDGGTITWITGQNTGASMEMKTYLPTGQICILWLGMSYPIAVGDQFIYYAGCDKTRQTCAVKFNNVVNMRGEPDMPGNDTMLSYPDAV
jgi:hypothetical protein